jgi:hypothetical protein
VHMRKGHVLVALLLGLIVLAASSFRRVDRVAEEGDPSQSRRQQQLPQQQTQLFRRGSSSRSMLFMSSRTGGLTRQCRGREWALGILQQATENAIDQKCKPSVQSLLSLTTTRRQKAAGGGEGPAVYGMTTCDVRDLCDQLPTWKQVRHLYGDGPVVMGSCTAVSPGAQIRVAGLYNSGTSVVAATLRDNLAFLFPEQPQQRDADADAPKVWEVPYGKHVPAKYRDVADEDEEILPIVVVRDPFRWMASMVCILGERFHSLLSHSNENP